MNCELKSCDIRLIREGGRGRGNMIWVQNETRGGEGGREIRREGEGKYDKGTE